MRIAEELKALVVTVFNAGDGGVLAADVGAVGECLLAEQGCVDWRERRRPG